VRYAVASIAYPKRKVAAPRYPVPVAESAVPHRRPAPAFVTTRIASATRTSKRTGLPSSTRAVRRPLVPRQSTPTARAAAWIPATRFLAPPVCLHRDQPGQNQELGEGELLRLRHPMPCIELLRRCPCPSCIEDHQRLSPTSLLTGSPPPLSHQDTDRAPIYPRRSALPLHVRPASQHGAALHPSAPPSNSCLACRSVGEEQSREVSREVSAE
jgi:hypothetical protein